MASWSLWPIFALVILVSHLTPIGGEDGAARSLITLHHGTARLRIAPLIDLLEEAIEGLVALRLIILELVVDLTVERIPIGLLLVRGGVGGALALGCRDRDGCGASRRAASLEHTPLQLLGDLLDLNLNLLGRASESTVVRIYRVGEFDLGQDFAGRGIF